MNSSTKRPSTDVVVFIDALKPSELEGFLQEIYRGDMDAGVPRVTPRVMSSIYTGLDPAENGMMEVSRFGGEDTTRPKKSTFIDQAVREGMDVLSMGMPFSVPFQINNVDEDFGSMLHGDALQGAQQVLPEEASPLVQVPAPTMLVVWSDGTMILPVFLLVIGILSRAVSLVVLGRRLV